MFINSTVCEDIQKNKTGSVLIEMTYLWGCVSVVGVENEYVLHMLSVFFNPYLTNMQRACAVLFYHVFRV